MKIKPFLVKTHLPENLSRLRDLAMNLWFSWNQDAVDLFVRLGHMSEEQSNGNYWEKSYQNPVKLLSILPQEELMKASADDSFISNLDDVWDKFQKYLNQKTWFQEKYGDNFKTQLAYFSCEYGLDECLPVYSGGLGILSGDHLKTASDMGIPLVGIGLLYQQGYFQQYLNNDGWQQETYPMNDWYNLPVSMEQLPDGTPLTIQLTLLGEEVRCRIWRVQVGRVPLYLLDTNIPENSPEFRRITHQLYGGDREMRIQQEIVLGIGGIRALTTLGIEPTVYHINEGHSAFLAIERIRNLIKDHGLSYREAWEIVFVSNVFTTHTPVPAGNEHFGLDLVRKYFTEMARDIGMSIDEFIELGQEYPKRSNTFCMTVLALRMAAFANGVSRLHGDTSRSLWHFLWKDLPLEEVPISHVTNGIHTLSWMSGRMQDLLERYLGRRFVEEPENVEVWNRIDSIPDNEIWRVRQIRRDRLIGFTRKRVGMQLARRGATPAEVRKAEEILDPHALTIGFARRFASYKRAALLFQNPERLAKLLSRSDYPVQIIFAGKAHPQDNPGKELIRRIFQMAQLPEFRNHIAFLENYDITVARTLVQGVDIWLNTPRRPLEASGTSGMKVAVNGGLNVSILDGWWDEGYGGQNGWAIGSGEVYDDPDMQDAIESEALYRLLEQEIVPLYYDRDKSRLPRQWIRMMKDSLKSLGSYFNTHRMLVDYTEQLYMKASIGTRRLYDQNYQGARDLAAWRDRVSRDWTQVRVIESAIDNIHEIRFGDKIRITGKVALGFLKPDDIQVECYFGVLDAEDRIVNGETVALKPVQEADGGWLYEGELAIRNNGRCGYAIRIIPHHPLLVHPYTPSLVRWE